MISNRFLLILSFSDTLCGAICTASKWLSDEDEDDDEDELLLLLLLLLLLILDSYCLLLPLLKALFEIILYSFSALYTYSSLHSRFQSKLLLGWKHLLPSPKS